MKSIYALIPLILLPMGITVAPWSLAQAETPGIEFKAPNLEPPSRIGSSYMSHGGPRCRNYYTYSLIPPNQVGVTIGANPHLFFYVDNQQHQSSDVITLRIELSNIQDENQDVLYSSMVTVPTANLPGIVSFPIPETVSSQLKVGQFYQWIFELYCGQETGDPTLDADYIGGFMYRIEPNRELLEKLAKAKPLEQVSLYAENGIWYEALSRLAALRQSDPQNQELNANWASLFHSVGFDTRYSIELDTLIQAPLLNCCVVEDNHPQ